MRERWALGVLLVAACASGGADDSRGPVGAASSSDTGATTGAASSSTGEPEGATDPTTQALLATGSESSSTGGDESSSGTGAGGCGDGEVVSPEQCDDGNAVDGDGCNLDCQASGRLLWSTTHAGALGLADEAMDCAVDGGGSIYIAGFVGLSKDDEDLWLGKYGADGVPLWSHQFAGTSKLKDQARAVVVDPAELVYVAGLAHTLMQNNDVFVRKFAADGAPLWTKAFNGAAMLGDVASAAALTPEGDLLVGGGSTVAGAGNDTWLRKYSPEGATLWTRSYAGAGKSHDETNALAVTPEGYFYAAGSETAVGEGRNMWVGKYDPDGNLLWSRVYSGAAGKDDHLHGAVVMADGGVVVCGYETAERVPWHSFVRRYDGDGLAMWTELEDGPEAAGAVCYGLTLAPDGDLLLAGAVMQAEHREPRVRRLTADGEPLWSTVLVGEGTGGSQARCVRAAPDGTVIVAGGQDAGVDGRDAFIARLSQ